MALVVQKFGGSSVATAERIMAAARRALRAKQAGNQVIVVVSARGDTTDELISLAREISDQPPAREMDMLLSTGEQISIALMAMAIQGLGQPAISFTGAQIGIVTDSFHTRARIKNISTERMRQALDEGNVVIVAGFQGVDENYNITTLGRGGSDTTAVALAAVMKRAQVSGGVGCEIYTDVDGVYTTDPRLVPEARKIDFISYDEMLELASVGAGVMHSRSIEFAKKFDVPLQVRSSFSDMDGTWIVPESDWMRRVPVCGAALVRDEARVNLEGVPDQPGVSHRVFSAIAGQNIVVDMIAQNVGSGGRAAIGFTVLRNDLAATLAVLRPLAAELGAALGHEEDVSKVSVVGSGMRTHAGVAENMFAALADAGINMKMITTGDIKISVLVDKADGLRALRAVHYAFDLHRSRPLLEGVGRPQTFAGQSLPLFQATQEAGEEVESAEGPPPHPRLLFPEAGARGEFGLSPGGEQSRSQRPAFSPLPAAGGEGGTPTTARPPGVERETVSAAPPAEHAESGMEDIVVSDILLKTDQGRITVFDLPDRPGNCSRIFEAVAARGIVVDMIVQNLTGRGGAELSFSVSRQDVPHALAITEHLTQEMDRATRVVAEREIAKLFVLGVGMRTHTGVARRMFGALAERGINISMINTSEVRVSAVVDRERGEEALACLRRAFSVGVR